MRFLNGFSFDGGKRTQEVSRGGYNEVEVARGWWERGRGSGRYLPGD